MQTAYRRRAFAGIENTDAKNGFHSDRNPSYTNMASPHYEYKSKKTIKGLPLVHVNTGLGLFSMGALTIGQFSYGALAYGKQVAIGDEAHGRIALGFSRAMGELYEEVRMDHKFDYPTIEKVIDENVPSH